MAEPKIAEISEEKIETIRSLEKKLGDKVCLVALEKTGSLYVLEAKLAPNLWERVDKAYPEIGNLRAYYTSKEDAHITKSSLKKLLGSKKNLKNKKHPIRMRKIE